MCWKQGVFSLMINIFSHSQFLFFKSSLINHIKQKLFIDYDITVVAFQTFLKTWIFYMKLRLFYSLKTLKHKLSLKSQPKVVKTSLSLVSWKYIFSNEPKTDKNTVNKTEISKNPTNNKRINGWKKTQKL